MGVVYRARDDELGRTVAVKVLGAPYADDPAGAGRFQREALAGARLSSQPHVVTLFDVGEWRGRPFMVMEYLAGGSVADRIATAPAAVGTALSWLAQAGEALDAAHAGGVVHRDVKPGNLLLDEEGELRVADFGIARAAGLETFTATGTVLGTAGYLSPEQARGEPAGPASDRYALAVVAFELLAGSRPFASESPAGEVAAHVYGAVPSASRRRPALPAGVDPVFERALAKDPAARFPSCGAFVAALREAVEGTTATQILPAAAPTAVLERPATVPLAARRDSRRWGRRAIAVAAGVALLTGGAVTAALLAGHGGTARAVEIRPPTIPVPPPRHTTPRATTPRATSPRPAAVARTAARPAAPAARPPAAASRSAAQGDQGDETGPAARAERPGQGRGHGQGHDKKHKHHGKAKKRK
jgi:serine/threonine-protein kinase